MKSNDRKRGALLSGSSHGVDFDDEDSPDEMNRSSLQDNEDSVYESTYQSIEKK